MIVKGLEELKALKGKEIGTSDWFQISQDRINAFADATNDYQWIHVDEEKAKASPQGSTIAHGFLTLSLLPYFTYQLWEIQGVKQAFNYGLNKVRFTSFVPVDSRIRMRLSIKDLDEIQTGIVQLHTQNVFEREGDTKPVCMADSIARLFFH